MSNPTLIVVGGMSGCGKTTLAAALVKHLPDAVHLDSDRIRKGIFGVSETTRLPPEAYSLVENQRVIDEMDRRIKKFLAEGKTVVVSAAVLSSRIMVERERLAAESHAQFIGIFLQADLHILFDRVVKRVNNVSDAGVDIVQLQAGMSLEPGNWPVIDTSQSLEDVVMAALKIIQDARKT